MENKEEAEKAIEILLKHCNIMSPGYSLGELLNEKVSSEHRTIQQTFVKEIHQFLVLYSANNSDLRNEASVNFAKRVNEMEEHFPFI